MAEGPFFHSIPSNIIFFYFPVLYIEYQPTLFYSGVGLLLLLQDVFLWDLHVFQLQNTSFHRDIWSRVIDQDPCQVQGRVIVKWS